MARYKKVEFKLDGKIVNILVPSNDVIRFLEYIREISSDRYSMEVKDEVNPS